MQEAGWWVRSPVIWFKPNALPSSARDRPARSYEPVLLFTKSERYFYDSEAVRTPSSEAIIARYSREREGGGKDRMRQTVRKRGNQPARQGRKDIPHQGFDERWAEKKRRKSDFSTNLRDVWMIPTQSYPGPHFATFPERLVETCVLAGTPADGVCAECGAPPAEKYSEDGWEWVDGCLCGAEKVPAVVFDPFTGSGTTGVVALRHGRSFVGIEGSPYYVGLAREHILRDAPLLNGDAERL